MSDERELVRGAAPSGDPHPAPPGAHAMNVIRWVLFAGLLLLAVASIGSYVAWRAGAGGSRAARQKALYHCPMHPTYTSDRPGDCPICGMSLEPIPEGAQDHGGESDVPGLAEVTIDARRQQMIGVRTAVAERRTLSGALDLVGFVTPDEARLHRVQLRVAGWVQKLYVSRTGERVRAGQPLMTIYSPELYQSEREYLIERDVPADSGMVHTHVGSAAASARMRLTLLGVPDEELERLEREGTPAVHLTLRTTVSGTVLERGVSEGQYVGPDTPLYTVADLSRMWVLADLYELDTGRVKPGDRATFVSDALARRDITGHVDFVYPTVTEATRTIKVRIIVANPDGKLRPGMYGRVLLSGAGPSTLSVPTEAVIRTGANDYVFVARAGGRFEPRTVRLGAESGDWVQVLGGIAEGDTVVASASFLIDSESRLKAAISGMGAPASGAAGSGAAGSGTPGHRH